MGVAGARVLLVLVGLAHLWPVSVEAARRQNMDLYVAVNGRDEWSGRWRAPNRQKTDGPFATLERARDEIRHLKEAGSLPPGGVTVHLRGGTYFREQAFELGPEDSGTPEAPITYRAYRGEKVRLVGGKALANWQPVTEPRIQERLDPVARGNVLQADLKAVGVTDFGQVKQGGLELFFQSQPMPLARWPNEGFVRIADVLGPTRFTSHGRSGCREGALLYEGDRPARWVEEKDIWLHGYWFWDWSDSYQRVASIDPEKRLITLAPPEHGYGYAKGQRYYALNLLIELDTPGEWYLDRERGILYFWPPAPVREGETLVSTIPTLVALKNVSHVRVQGLTLEACRGTAVTIEGGKACRVTGCTLRNTGSWAVRISGGHEHAVVGCDIYETGDGGIALSGGDRETLTSSAHLAENNHIYRFGRWNRTYRPAVEVGGVGQRVRHNLIHHGPHNAIQLAGNDHLVEFNEIHSVCYETGDVGAFYMGRDWTARGTIIRHNYFHHIAGPGLHGAMAVYLDDMACGITVFGNLFYRAGRAVLIGGGRDNRVENNIFVECPVAIHVDARAMGWASGSVGTTMTQRLQAVPYKGPIWSQRYPELVNILEDEPAAPKGNLITRNLCWGGRWEWIEPRARPYLTLRDNLTEGDPGFMNAKRLDFRLREDSPAWKIGFQRIPIEQIGLYKDETRASWPVKHTPREVPAPAAQPSR